MAEPARKIKFDPQDSERGWRPQIIVGGGEGGEGENPNLRVIEGGGNRIETPSEEAKNKTGRHLSIVPDLKEAEDTANKPAKPQDVASQEAGGSARPTPNIYRPDPRKESEEARRRKRNIRLGIGASGSLIGLIMGLSVFITNSLTATIDGLVHNIEQRIEKYGARRTTKLIAKKLFAKTPDAKFEAALKEKYGVTIKRAPDGSIEIFHEDESLGKFSSQDEVEKFLASGAEKAQQLAAAVADYITNSGVWRWFKRIALLDWLRVKFNILNFGGKEEDPAETDAQVATDTKTNTLQEVGGAEAKNVEELVNIVDGEDPNNVDELSPDQIKELQSNNINTLGGGTDLETKVAAAVDEVASEEGTAAGAKEASKSLIERIVSKVLGEKIGAKVGSLVPYIGQIDFVVRIVHLIQTGLEKSTFQKVHAAFMKRNYITLFATFAGYSDKAKAGKMRAAEISRLSAQVSGDSTKSTGDTAPATTTAAYRMTNGDSNILAGSQLDGLKRVGDNQSNPAFVQAIGSVLQVANLPIAVWYKTVSFALDKIGGVVGDVLSAIPGADKALALFTPVISTVLTGILGILGFNIDPAAVGALLYMSLHAGTTGMFNNFGKDNAFRKLTPQQARDQYAEIKADNAAKLAKESFTDRLLNLDNHDSLASTLLTKLSLPSNGDPIGTLAFTGAGLLAKAPANLATIMTPSAAAATENLSPEDLSDQDAYGATDADLNLPFTAGPSTVCAPPSPDGSTFDPCMFDKGLDKALSCQLEEDCPELADTDNTMLDDSYDTNSYAPRVAWYIPSAQETSNLAKTEQAWGLVGALLPIGALEVSRRRV